MILSRRAALSLIATLAPVSSARLAARQSEGLIISPSPAQRSWIVTVNGAIRPEKLGMTLMHEHVLVDFIGADKVSPDRYDRDAAFEVVLPHLQELRKEGCSALVECTPSYLGRDPELLRGLAEASGLAILTNTGYYGAAQDKFLPTHAFTESADQLAARWTREYREGIGQTAIRPGFLKLGVDAGPLSDVDRKLIVAGARCHLQTGLTIHVHTGDGRAALDILETLQSHDVAPGAYVWVHAQNEKERSVHLKAAEQGAWIEFDGIGPETMRQHVDAVHQLCERGHAGRVLISQDAGWYRVGEAGGGKFRGYTFLFERFLPALRRKGITESTIQTLLVDNPAEALSVRVRKANDHTGSR
ncbi:MAG: phosphotriesterase family protein [Acidobacteriota bacterium]